jgi:hypothetical protein
VCERERKEREKHGKKREKERRKKYIVLPSHKLTTCLV